MWKANTLDCRRRSRSPPVPVARLPVNPAHSQGITIQPASVDDVEALGRLGALLVATHHGFDPARFVAATSRTGDGYGAFLATQLEAPDVVVLVARRDTSVVGYTYAAVEGRDYMSLRGPAGVLHDIVVDRSERGKGIARRLLAATLGALAARGARQVVLFTAARNEVAQRLFAGAGFRTTMVEMTRELNGDADEP